MTEYLDAMQKKNFFDEDVEIERFGRIYKRKIKLDGMTVDLVSFPVGSNLDDDCVKTGLFPEGQTMCHMAHVSYILQGAIKIRQHDGSEEVFRKGDMMLLPPHHDAWTEGNEDCVFLDFSRGYRDMYDDDSH